MDIPERVTQLADFLREKGFTPVGFADVEDLYVIQIAEGG